MLILNLIRAYRSKSIIMDVVYSAAEEEYQKEWNSGLFACCSDQDSCRFCILSCFCPGIAYGINTNTIAGNGPYTACTVHSAVDCCMLTDLFQIVSSFTTYAPLPSIACCLRYTHRRAAANGREHAAMSMLRETFCWSCSMTQVRKEFRQEETKTRIVCSSELLGTLEAAKLKGANNMEPPL